ncbi:MAG: amino acid adenylation domain-containing protein, partial [Pseudonocardia sediminis]
MSTAPVRSRPEVTDPAGEVLELTAAQLGIWNAQRLEPDSRHYLVGDVLEVSGPDAVDVAALAEAVRRTTEEAESLRLRVFDTPDGPRQIVSSEPVRAPRVVDLRAERDPAAAAQATVDAERVRAAEACRAMVDRPLYHQVLVRVSDREVWYVQLGHHLIFDGYSAAMLCRRIAAHHTALTGGAEAAPSTFGRFADLVEADLAYRSSERFSTDRDYWRDRLTPLPELGETGEPAVGPPDRTLTARTVLGPDRLDRLRAVADDAHVTWGEVLIACYAAFLHRVCGASDVVFALPLMCRSGKAALRTPAMAVNVLPLRVDVRGGDRLDELSRRTAEAMREMRAHQRYRGENLPRDVPGAGALLHGRGVNLKAFDFSIDLAGATGVLRNVAGGPPEDFGLTATPTADGGLLLGFEVDARTNDQDTVDARLDALVTLVEELSGPGLPPVGGVALMDPDRRAQVLADRCVPSLPGRPADVPTLLAELVATNPDRTALVAGDERLTAAGLTARVHRLARVLRSHGAGPDVVVAIALPRSADLVVALLAVLDAGAAFLVLDTDHPPARLRGIVDDARPALLVTSSDRDPDLPDGPERVVLGEIPDGPGDPLAPAELVAPRDPEHLAYVIYTSGSTGRPKGVLGRVGGLASLVHHHRSTVVADAARDAGRPLRAAHTYSFSFDAALDQLMWLLCGHELHLYGSDLVRDADALLAAYHRDRIDVVDTTPSLAAPLVEAGLLDLPLRMLILGGEATPDALWRRVHASGIAAFNLYGPTEASVDATLARVDDGDPTIGLPLAGTRTYLLDNARQPVPHGAPGELYLAGPHLARGYAGRPDLTADRFVADPFGGPGERMYRTGDRARWVPGRGIVHLGRDDGQVKIRGYRVEIGEVESGLSAVPGVAAAAAVVRTDGGRARLVGYVVPSSAPLTPDAVRESLAERVPDHLVPSAVVVLDALPVTVNGKLDRAALPVPRWESSGREAGTERERLLCGVVAEVFDLDRVGVDEDFFALGGDSITAISVSSRLRAVGLDLRPRDLLARRTLASLAAGAGEVDGAAEAAPDDPTGPVPAPPIVRALLDPHPDLADVAGYAQWTALRIDEPLALPDLVAGVQTVLDRHDALRLLVTGGDGGEPAQLLVRPRGAVAATGVVREVTDTAVLAGLAADLASELAPRSGDLMRVALVRTPDGEPDRLLVLAHHLVADGVSWRILLPDLHEACTAAAAGRAPEPAPSGTSWRRHATLLAEEGEKHTRAPELAYWRRAAAGDHLGDRGLDRSRDTVATATQTTTTASAEVTDALVTTLPAAYRAGVHEVLLTALALALRTWRAERGRPVTDATTVTVEGHGRDRVGTDLSRTVGWFTAEYPVPVPTDAVRDDTDLADALGGGPAAGRLLRAVKEALRAGPDGGVGYGVLRHLDPRTRDELAAGPPPDVLLNYLGRFAASPGDGWRLPEGAAFAVVEPPGKALEQVLALNCFVHEDGAPRLSVEWTAAGLMLRPGVVAQLQAHFAAALDALAAHAARIGPDGGGLTPSDLPLVDL